MFINNLADPITAGAAYLAEMVVNSITTGSVYITVNLTKTEAVSSAGTHKMIVRAGLEGGFGVFGDYTDAVIDRVSLREITLRPF